MLVTHFESVLAQHLAQPPGTNWVPFFLGTQIVSDDDKLAAYRWFKQATVGDIDIPQPKILDFNWAARQKWKAWKTAEGTNKETAMQNYLAEMKRQRQKYGE